MKIRYRLLIVICGLMTVSQCSPLQLDQDPAAQAASKDQTTQRTAYARTEFKADGPSSCEGHCGTQAPGGCYCDDQCAANGDCCPDKGTVCEGTPVGCQGSCGKKSPDGCYCDALCAQFGDCCADYQPICAQPTPTSNETLTFNGAYGTVGVKNSDNSHTYSNEFSTPKIIQAHKVIFHAVIDLDATELFRADYKAKKITDPEAFIKGLNLVLVQNPVLGESEPGDNRYWILDPQPGEYGVELIPGAKTFSGFHVRIKIDQELVTKDGEKNLLAVGPWPGPIGNGKQVDASVWSLGAEVDVLSNGTGVDRYAQGAIMSWSLEVIVTEPRAKQPMSFEADTSGAYNAFEPNDMMDMWNPILPTVDANGFITAQIHMAHRYNENNNTKLTYANSIEQVNKFYQFMVAVPGDEAGNIWTIKQATCVKTSDRDNCEVILNTPKDVFSATNVSKTQGRWVVQAQPKTFSDGAGCLNSNTGEIGPKCYDTLSEVALVLEKQ